jgi:hypothetical protein
MDDKKCKKKCFQALLPALMASPDKDISSSG